MNLLQNPSRLTILSPRRQSEVQHPVLKSRMETASVPSGLTLPNAVGNFKPQYWG